MSDRLTEIEQLEKEIEELKHENTILKDKLDFMRADVMNSIRAMEDILR